MCSRVAPNAPYQMKCFFIFILCKDDLTQSATHFDVCYTLPLFIEKTMNWQQVILRFWA